MNEYDENGKFHGLQKRYYDNGKLYYEGDSQHGKRIGLWEYYYRNGQIWCKGAYKKGKFIGLWYEDKYA